MIGKDRKLSKKLRTPPGINMTTANGKPPTFSEKHPKFCMISDHNRVKPKLSEVHIYIARNLSRSIRPWLP